MTYDSKHNNPSDTFIHIPLVFFTYVNKEMNTKMRFIYASTLFIVFLFLIGFQTANIYANEYIVQIPFGAYNPELNTPAEVWFDPPKITVLVNDTITWVNSDREGHTVTSGMSSGRFGWMSDDFGTPSGIFDSGRFLPDKSWSHTFKDDGVFPYFCVIHPWMEGVVIVEKLIPDYPHDATRKRLELPALAYTPDGAIEVNLTWEPNVIRTHELTKLIFQFYDPYTNSNLAKMKYNFIIYQNGKELYRDSGVNQIGGDYRNFVFEESGSIIVRFTGIESAATLADSSTTVLGDVSDAQRSVDFTTVVYDNPDKTTHEEFHIKPAQRLEFYYELAILIIIVPVALLVFAIWWMKKAPQKPKQQ
jgi:plastocyanin